jgi:alpha-tubulin suppressor-like RCC1 family protein
MKHAFSGGEMIPNARPTGCSESWVAYLARCARQRRCREAAPIAPGWHHGLFADAAGRLLACGKGPAVGHGDADSICFDLAPVAALAGIRVLSVAADVSHSLALSSDGRVYSWGYNEHGQLGQGDQLNRPAPALVVGLEGVRDIAASEFCSLAVTQSGIVFHWGEWFHLKESSQSGEEDDEINFRPVIVEGFGVLHVRQMFAVEQTIFAIGEAGQLFSWGYGQNGLLGHGDKLDQPSPKRVEALRDIRVISVSAAGCHALALAGDGLVYAWGRNMGRAVLGNPHVERELLPKPVEALRGVRVGSIAAAGLRSYAVADTGEVWAWGVEHFRFSPLGYGEQMNCPLPEPMESLRCIKVDAVAASEYQTLALADDGSVYTWGGASAARLQQLRWEGGALGLSPSVSGGGEDVPTPQRVPNLRVACGLRWGFVCVGYAPPWHRGHGGEKNCPIPKPIGWLQGVRVDAVAAAHDHTLAWADDGSVSIWSKWISGLGSAPGLSLLVSHAGNAAAHASCPCGLWGVTRFELETCYDV